MPNFETRRCLKCATPVKPHRVYCDDHDPGGSPALIAAGVVIAPVQRSGYTARVSAEGNKLLRGEGGSANMAAFKLAQSLRALADQITAAIPADFWPGAGMHDPRASTHPADE